MTSVMAFCKTSLIFLIGFLLVPREMNCTYQNHNGRSLLLINMIGGILESISTANNACDGNPCRNGGTCVDSNDGWETCQCRPPYTGIFCEIDACEANLCKNGGTCQITEDGYMCICESQFDGYNCEYEVCGGIKTCGENETCLENNDDGSFDCICRNNYIRINGICVGCGCGDNEECFSDDDDDEVKNISCRCEKKHVRQNGKCVYCSKDCAGLNEVCEPRTANEEACVCVPGFVRVGQICLACTKTCGENQICAIRPDDEEQYCVCKNGYIEDDKYQCVKEKLTSSTTSSSPFEKKDNDPTKNHESTTPEANCGGILFCEKNEICKIHDDGSPECVCQKNYAKIIGDDGISRCVCEYISSTIYLRYLHESSRTQRLFNWH